MMTAEPLVHPYLEAYPALAMLAYLAFVPGILWAGFAANHRGVGCMRGDYDAACVGRCVEGPNGAVEYAAQVEARRTVSLSTRL